MPDAHKQVLEILEAEGFSLVRQRKHAIFKNVDGLAWTIPSTPSDHRAWQNNLHRLRKVLKESVPSRASSVPESGTGAGNGDNGTAPHSVPAPEASRPAPRSLGIPIDKYLRMNPPKPMVTPEPSIRHARLTLLEPYAVNTVLRREMLRSFAQFTLEPGDDPDFDTLTAEEREAIATSHQAYVPEAEWIRRKQRFWLDRFHEHNLRLERACALATKTSQQLVKSLRKVLVVRITSTYIERRQLRSDAEMKLAREFAVYLTKAFAATFQETLGIVKELVAATLYHFPLCLALSLAYRLRFEAKGIVISSFYGRGPDTDSQSGSNEEVQAQAIAD